MPPKMNNLAPTSQHPLYVAATSQSKVWPLVRLTLGIALLIALGLAFLNFRTLRDWYILANYQPPTAISALANQDDMTSYARRLFYVNKPQIETKTIFAGHCTTSDASAHVIGCYHEGDNGIFLLDVKDPRLNGIIEVTAAYEMLHAGYARLNSATRSELNSEMWHFYTRSDISYAIKQQMASYAISEPGARYDELYSVLGTEVATLPKTLEDHFKIYFNDRAAIIAQYDGYQAAFNSREAAISADNVKLSALHSQIDSNENQLNNILSNINFEQQTLNTERSAGSIAIYNSGVAGFNSLVDQYNQLVFTVRSEITQYNSLVSVSNQLAIEDQQLVEAITSTPSTQTTK